MRLISIFLMVLIFATSDIAAQEIKQNFISSEPKLTPPATPKDPEYMGEETQPPEEPDLDNFFIKDPDEPLMEEPFKYLTDFYDKLDHEPVTGEPTIRLNPNECPVGMVCNDIENSLLFEPPYIPGEPYIKKPTEELP